jgi:hypothetical protein
MSKHSPKAIGGYFELELPQQRKHLYPDAIRFQSARAAFYALLIEGRPKRVWMPTYICDSMLAPLKTTATEVVFYNIDSCFGVSNNVQIEDGDWLLYVNYFGVCTAQEDQLLKQFKSSQLVFDHSQAFFSPPRDCLATIYSPRKFFGIPDGGLLYTSLSVIESNEIDVGSSTRCSHLLKRLDGAPETGYHDFKIAEQSLCDMQPRRLSLLTDRLLESIDYEACKKQRNNNFNFLHDQLKHLNNLDLHMLHIAGPMCYPLLVDDAAVREILLANRIYIPTYWPEVSGRVKPGSFDRNLLEKCLPLPCDQRYQQEDMARIVELVKGIW